MAHSVEHGEIRSEILVSNEGITIEILGYEQRPEVQANDESPKPPVSETPGIDFFSFPLPSLDSVADTPFVLAEPTESLKTNEVVLTLSGLAGIAGDVELQLQ